MTGDFFKKYEKSSGLLTVVIRVDTITRLLTTCFRGKDLKLAGNFSLWGSINELMMDFSFVNAFLDGVEEVWLSGDTGTHSLEIEHSDVVGWNSTISSAGFAQGNLERFSLNRRATGLRVKKDKISILAPMTKKLTMIYELRDECGPVVVIHSIYPGEDIGELSGDVSLREKIVFFDWHHPGV